MDLVLVDEEISDRVIEVKEGESLNLNLAAFKAFPAVKIDIKVARNATLTAVFADFSKGEGRFVLNVYLEDVFTDPETANKYIRLFNEEQLDLIHLEEAVEDILHLC